MPSLLSLLFLLLTPAAGLAAALGPPLPDHPAERVAEDVYVIHGPLEFPNPRNQGFMNNPGFVLTDAGVVVIDPGSSVQTGEMVLRAIGKLTSAPVVAVFNTHIHGDHWLGNQAIRQAYPDATIYAHPAMIELIRAGEGQAWVERMAQLTEGRSAGTRVVAPERAVRHGETFRIGGKTFRIHHYGKSHTTSDIMIEVVEPSVVFLGDNVLNRRLPRIDDGDIQGNIRTCTQILKAGLAVHVPGHGHSGDRRISENFRAYLQTLYRSVKRHYEAGLSDFEMKPKVAADLKDFADWSGFEEQLGRHISLAYLQIEAAEF